MQHSRGQVKGAVRALAAALTALLAFSAHTDTLELGTGERYEGSLVDIRSGTLSFRTALAGRIFVPVSEVRALDTSNFVAVTVDESRLLPGRIETLDGAFYVLSGPERERTPLQLDRVTQVDRLPETPKPQPDATESSPDSRISVETGYRVRLGTTDTSGPYVRVEGEGETEKLRYEAQGDIEYTTDASAADRFYHLRGALGGAEGPVAPQVQLETRRDTNRGIQNRTDLSAGAEGAFLDDAEQELRGFAGVGVTVQEWDSSRLRADEGISAAGEPSTTREDLSLHLQLRYSRYIFSDTRLTERLVMRPSLSNGGDLRAALESELSVPLSLRFRLQLDLLLDYDNSSPYRGIDDWSAAMNAGIRVEF